MTEGYRAGDYPEVVEINLSICVDCLEPTGNECHTPGCAFWMHDVPTANTADALRWARTLMQDNEIGG